MSSHFSKALFLARQCEQHHRRRCARIQILHARDDLRPLISHGSRIPPIQTQSFSTSRPWRVQAEKKKHSKMDQMMEQMKKQGHLMSEEVGLLPGTFIMPFGKNLPSWSSNFKGRLLLEKKGFKARFMEAGAAFFYKFIHVRPRPKLHYRRIPRVAEDLHKSMYEHFAAGNLQPIESSICSGMMGSLRGRIAHRPPGTQLKWTLHKYVSPSKLVSWRPAVPPLKKGEKKAERKGIVQAVVRIHSLQSLQNVRRKGQGSGSKEVLVDSQGRELQGGDNSEQAALKHAKELVEYVVVQKVLKNSREGPWKLWGTTEEMSLEKLEREQRKLRKREADTAIA